MERMITKNVIVDGAAISSAIFSLDMKYRYQLIRRWNPPPVPDLKVVTFIMTNPSTATEAVDDNTIRKCISYGKAWGCDGMCVVNLFALCSTDPDALYVADDPIGPNNDKSIVFAVMMSHLVVAAWGVHGALRGRGQQVLEMLSHGRPLHHLGLTKGGQPKHPLYLPGDLRPIPFDEQEAE